MDTGSIHSNQQPPQAGRSSLMNETRFRRIVGSILGLFAIVVVTTLPFTLLGNSMERVVLLAIIDMTAVIALSIFTGSSGILSVGHVGFFAVGAYTTGLLTTPVVMKADMLRHLPGFLAQTELSLPASLAVVSLVSLVLGVVTGLPLSRLREASAIVATFGLLVIVNYVLMGATNITNGNKGFYGIPQVVNLPIAYGYLLCVIAIAFAFKESNWGLQLRAFQDNEVAAAASGIDGNRRLLQAWTLSAVVMGVAGALFAHVIGAFQPRDFYLELTFAMVAMLVVGGKRSITGAVVGTLLVTGLVELVRPLENGVLLGATKIPPMWGAAQILLSLMILLVMYLRPAGLLATRELTIGRSLASAIPVAELVGERPPVTLSTDKVSVEFGGIRALSDVSVRVESGQIVGLIGPNGAGKTTLINCLTGLFTPSRGSVELGGTSIVGWSSSAIARSGLARTFQNIRLFGEMTVLENVITAALARGHTATGVEAYARGLLLQFDLLDESDRTASTLSYGNQRRLEIARALALEPRFLLLDEPAAGMNPKESEGLIRAILEVRKKYGLGILIVEHDLHLIMRLCDMVYVLSKGEMIASGTAASVQNDPQVIDAYLGTQVIRSRRKSAKSTAVS